MDPLTLAEFWWAVPAAAGAVGAGAWGAHRMNAERRLGYDAARLELRQAVADATAKQNAARVARADLARITAERAASRASAEDVGRARRELQAAQREAKAAAAAVKALRTRVAAARAEIPARSEPTPLDRLRAQHDTVLVRWMQYETDPARAIAYPTMSDGHVPATAAFLGALENAQARRPAEGKVTPAEFTEYRLAVVRLEQAFDDAERAARLAAGERPTAGPGWQDAAQQVITLSADVLDRAAGVAASAIAAWRDRSRPDGGQSAR
ncbi:hypothetical protein [Microbacterium sp. CIAB417]|uniref:hypothetical protein n=1 Tax=Microbacterium sp. CIAB417 TaxID=2860287 RepID=UPI001FADA66B|nr:hypothetical protein [Microbacterium sp. CIAB417]